MIDKNLRAVIKNQRSNMKKVAEKIDDGDLLLFISYESYNLSNLLSEEQYGALIEQIRDFLNNNIHNIEELLKAEGAEND